jgi:hypothetical protein
MSRNERGSRAASDEPRLIEVELARKYVPHHAYELANADEVRAERPEGEPSPTPRFKPLLDEEGALILQRDQKVDHINLKTGEASKVRKEILDSCPPGSIIPLPQAEAERAIRGGVANITSRSFA